VDVRTTLTLDDDLARELQDLSHRLRKPFKAVLNETLRKGLGNGGKKTALEPFRIKHFAGGLRPGIDPNKLNRLVDELEVEAFLGKMKRDSDRSRR
jgi:predicted transcriptional regulator